MHISSSVPGVDLHLTYCLNIHAGESWAENFAAIRSEACAVRDRLGVGGGFGLGLRLSAQAGRELRQAQNLEKFKAFLRSQDMYVFTINGFPYGTFHAAVVKHEVYAPDWAEDARLAYTLDLIAILAELLPAGVDGSISTVPGSYRQWCRQAPERLDLILERLGLAAWNCRQVLHETGRHIRLALEPEPDCLWDTTRDVLHLFNHQIPERGVQLLSTSAGISKEDSAAAFAEHLGICFDTCHQAVMGEGLSESLDLLAGANIKVAKIQVSAAPVARSTPEAIAELAEFIDPVYLHQTVIGHEDGRIEHFPDLDEALAVAAQDCGGECEIRTHFHVPLTIEKFGRLQTTRKALTPTFWNLVKRGVSSHIEVETYTFSVLPPGWRTQGVVENISGELKWVLEQLT